MSRPGALVFLLLTTAVVSVGCAAKTAGDSTDQGEADLTGDGQSLAAIQSAVKNVDEEHVTFGADVKAPSSSAGVGASADANGSIYGIDWYQKWGGGKSADHTWENGSDLGQRCMWASVARFDAIMKDAPPELSDFLAEYTKWNGSFYNWNDDYSGKGEDGEPAVGDAKEARLWAWHTELSKWVSATAKDGSCYLPTRQMLVDYASTCKAYAASHNGEMQGCEVRGAAD